MFDLEDLLEIGMLGNIFPADLGFLMTVVIIFLIGFIAIAWAFACVTRRNIGRKAGMSREKDWMAYIPFARTIYFLQAIGEQWYKMFIFEMWPLWWFLIGELFGLFENETMSTIGNVIGYLYVLTVAIYKISFRIKFYKAFNINSELALSTATVWGFLFLRRAFECLIAFTDIVNYRTGGNVRGLTEIIHPTPGGTPRANVGGGGAVSQASATTPSVTGMSGMYAGQTIPMASNDDLVIGRDADSCSIIIDQNAEKVSRKHCSIRYDSGRNLYMVTDFSSNGTFVDGGNRLTVNSPQLCNRGTILALGSRENRFRLN